MSKTKTYWKGIEELEQDEKFIASAHDEFKEEIPVDEFLSDSNLSNGGTSRRDFLKFLGFSVTAASLAACETPVTKTIPYVVKPEEITPGVANYYASTFSDGNDYCSILVKTREGRPIHISGNKLSGVTKGGVNARVNSSVLSLYDSERLRGPLAGGAESTWSSVDGAIGKKLSAIVAKGGVIRILSNSITSPSTKKVIGDFIAGLSSGDDENTVDAQHITYDDISASGMIQANEESFGVASLPDYKFDKAKSIVSIGADFMVNWLNSIQYAGDYATTRNPDSNWMSRLVQFETTLSLTGSNADQRNAIKASEHGVVTVALYNAVAKKLGSSSISGGTSEYAEAIESAASDLVAAKGSSIVVSGSNSKSDQVVVNGINSLLGNYGNTIDLSANVNIKQADDTKVEALVKEMVAGKVDALIVYGVNPAYSLPGAADAIAKVGLKISFSSTNDETAALCDYVCPDHHYLESWNDSNPKKGHYSLAQPTISPLFNTRQAQDSLLKWSGSDSDFQSFLMNNWKDSILEEDASLDDWNTCLRDGVFETSGDNIVDEDVQMIDEASGFGGDLSAAVSAIAGARKGGKWELVLYQKIGIGNGNQANNPWLQELSDPISKIVWDNYVTMAPSDMEKNGFEQKTGEATPASMVNLKVGDSDTVELPVIVQPGQKAGTIGLALGYGRTNGGRTATEAGGVNAFNYVSLSGGNLNYSNLDVSIEGSGNTHPIASTQTHHTLMGRDMIKESTHEEYKKDKRAGNPKVLVTNYDGKTKENPYKINLWNDHDIDKGHRWGLSIDLSTCNGCSACVTACHSENNVLSLSKRIYLKNSLRSI
ncbi:MAG: TAT-variant-translocated molybdopterin oxidoreductase [Bacteroidetes bacterium]|nr:TAT-variant-translocated molybdopterin oxidoreductase [Bacteroidota bacterium]